MTHLHIECLPFNVSLPVFGGGDIFIFQSQFEAWNMFQNRLRKNNHKASNAFMSEWLSFSATSAIFQLYHDENKLIFNDMMTRSSLY